MNIIILLFIVSNKFSYKKIESLINKTFNLPTWHYPSFKCKSDKDCPIPYACCHDAFFPFKDSFCCLHYKKREYEYAYIHNYIN